eukprot:CAMPEP_0181125290 /NCGR_PEP_ID=MMETSP1071-20121207/26956_1 /TAXON_ID=35127 /ORGANISM="Thalassiosira sp., Strain NH16" /LENGTH=752 /DNA_ID=CAMNT_0023210693 /DNA_START=1498 /DNA_END=3758 /DNA_ORIENTATION=-
MPQDYASYDDFTDFTVRDRVHYFGTTTTNTSDVSKSVGINNDKKGIDQSLTTRVHLPNFGQNGTLVLRSRSGHDDSSASVSLRKVEIISRWRDDALLEFLPLSNDEDIADGIGKDNGMAVGDTVEGDSDIDTFNVTNMPSHSSESSSSTPLSEKQTFGRLQITSPADGVVTSLSGRRGTLVEVDVLTKLQPSSPTASSNDEDHDNKRQSGNEPRAMKMVITVPEKSNVTCQMMSSDNGNDGCDITVLGKLEGDVHLSTSFGNIVVDKLRGQEVTLDNTGIAGVDNADGATSFSSLQKKCPSTRGAIHVRKAIEARTVTIATSSRVRARMLNASRVSVRAENAKQPTTARRQLNKLDHDDEGAIIDIGSLYVSNGGTNDGASDNDEAQLIVEDFDIGNSDDGMDSSSGLVRVKSSHGHVMVHARTNRNGATPRSSSQKEERQHTAPPLVDLGGVNGSCDVTMEATRTSGSCDEDIVDGEENSSSLMARVHFDAMTPESISTITSHGRVVGRHATTSITMDRKLEADMRILSVSANDDSGTASGLLEHADAHSLTSDDVEDIRSVLMKATDASMQNHLDGGSGVEMNMSANEKGGSSISIETDAYNGKWGLDALSADDANDNQQRRQTLSSRVEYTQGTMKNRSGEPDSRFDVRSRRRGGGKINVEGAASQALYGFQGKSIGGDGVQQTSSPPLPLLAVATDGKIKLETLSWFGSIARRYGLEEEEGGEELDGKRAVRLDWLNESSAGKQFLYG